MTLPLTRPPGGAARPRPAPRPPWWPGRPRLGGGPGARWGGRGPLGGGGAPSPRGPAVLLAACTLFAYAVAVFSTNPPERLWGVMAAGPYGVAGVARRLGGRGGGGGRAAGGP